MNERQYRLTLLVLAFVAIIWPILFTNLIWLPWLVILPVLAWFWYQEHLSIQIGWVEALALTFLLSAVLGTIIAFDPSIAWQKLGFVTGSLLLFLAISQQNSKSLPLLTGGANLTAALLGIFLISGLSRNSFGLDFGWLQNILPAEAIVNYSSNQSNLILNSIGGIIAVLLPLGLLDVWVEKRKQPERLPWLATLLLLPGIAGLVLSSSRGAWLALAAGLSVGLLTWLDRKLGWAKGRIGLVVCLLVMTIAMVGWSILVSAPQATEWINGQIAGEQTIGSRIELAHQSFYLIRDFPFTGAGLGAFGGVYSRYIRLIPQFYFSHPHQLFLDVLIAQGPLGLFSLLGILAASLGVTFQRTKVGNAELSSVLVLSVGLSGLTVLVIHGLLDSAAYSGAGVAFLFVYPALLLMDRPPKSLTKLPARWVTYPLALASLAGFILVVYSGNTRVVFRQTQASFIANQQNLRLARVELNGWPEADIIAGRQFFEDDFIQDKLSRVIELSPNNYSATYRIGLIEMRRGNYSKAAGYLNQAHGLAPNHRGVTKALGYVLAWQGQIDQAAAVLAPISEASRELELYSDWWLANGDSLLSEWSLELAERLDKAGQSGIFHQHSIEWAS